MINGKIEKEIKQQYKVVGEFTMRQGICLIVATAILIVIKLVSGLDFASLALPIIGAAYLAYIFGWKEKNGEYAERWLLKDILKKIYKNEIRGYRTMNRYVCLYNKAYSSLRAKDLSDKKKAKLYNKRLKQDAKKTSSMKGIL